MQSVLTAYLLQYKKLSLPGVGALHVVQRPAQLDVADKRIQPPAFSVEIGREEETPEHQLRFLEEALGADREAVHNELRSFGNRVKEQMSGSEYQWEGIGTLTPTTQTISLAIPALETVPAEKVLRPGAEHKVLIGDREITASPTAERKAEARVERKSSVDLIVGWVLLFLSILAIVLCLFMGKGTVKSGGSQMPVEWIGN